MLAKELRNGQAKMCTPSRQSPHPRNLAHRLSAAKIDCFR